LKLYKVTSKNTLAIEGRTYSAVDKGDNLILTHTVASIGLVQLTRPVVVTTSEVEKVSDQVFHASINTQKGTKKAYIKANPFGIRKDVYNADCVDCKTILDYCGALHNA